jgi:cation-transporting P-type ATPase I
LAAVRGRLEEFAAEVFAPLVRADQRDKGCAYLRGLLTAWLVGRATGTQNRASTIALATLIGAELGQTLLLGGRNPVVLATGLGSAPCWASSSKCRG